MRHLFLILGAVSLAGCFMNPDPFKQERQQSLAGQNVQTTEQQELLRREEDRQRQQAEIERQQRREQQEQQEAQAEPQAQPLDQARPPAVKQLRPQIRTMPRPGLMSAPTIATPVMLPPVLAR